jgi:hypothetical protein
VLCRRAGRALARHVAAGRGLWRQVTARPTISESQWSKIDLEYDPNMLKRFSEGFGLKKKLHEKDNKHHRLSPSDTRGVTLSTAPDSSITSFKYLFKKLWCEKVDRILRLSTQSQVGSARDAAAKLSPRRQIPANFTAQDWEVRN